MTYSNNIIMTIGVDDESTYGKKLGITVAVDTLGMCTISFGSQYSIRIPEDDVDALRDVLFDASRKLLHQRNIRKSIEQERNELSNTEPDYIMCQYCQDTYDVNSEDAKWHMCKQ